MPTLPEEKLEIIRRGTVIPATPLALTPQREFDPQRQAALMRYYIDAGVGGIAVGMHFTQFEIRLPGIDLYEPVLQSCAETIDACASAAGRPIVKVAGINGRTPEAIEQARTARELGYDLAIVSMAAFRGALPQEMIHHLRQLSEIMPLFGFYLLTGVGGIPLPYAFWRALVDLPNVYGIKIAPFNRYFTVDVCRAVAEAGREETITLYTGNDDSIVYDLVTPHRFRVDGRERTVRIKGGLLGQWGCWTKRAVELLEELHGIVDRNEPISPELLARSVEITDANAALFDPIHDFAGSIPGVNEVLRRQGLLATTVTLKPEEVLSPGQLDEIDRVTAAYPHLNDDAFVRENLQRWLAPAMAPAV